MVHILKLLDELWIVRIDIAQCYSATPLFPAPVVRTHIRTPDSEYFKSGEQRCRPCGYDGNFFRWHRSVGERPLHLGVKYCRSKDDGTFSRTVTASLTKIQAFTSDLMRCLTENKVTKRCLKYQIVPPKCAVFSCLHLKVHQRMFRYDVITVHSCYRAS